MTCSKSITVGLACTLCTVTFDQDKMQPWNDAVLCPVCLKRLFDALKIEEKHTKPWTIDEKLSDADWESELLFRRRSYYDTILGVKPKGNDTNIRSLIEARKLIAKANRIVKKYRAKAH